MWFVRDYSCSSDQRESDVSVSACIFPEGWEVEVALHVWVAWCCMLLDIVGCLRCNLECGYGFGYGVDTCGGYPSNHRWMCSLCTYYLAN